MAIELEPEFLDSSLDNNPQLWRESSVVICSDIREVNWTNNAPQCDVLVGGVPCVGASLSGRSKNKISSPEQHEKAGTLFMDYLEAVKTLNPVAVVLENVCEYMTSTSMQVIRARLESMGYVLAETILDGNDFGALERRKRMALVGISKGLPFLFDFTSMVSIKEKEACLNDILDDVPHDSPRWRSFEYLADKAVRDKAAGKGFARQLLDGSESYCGVIGKDYAKCRSTEPFLIHPENASLSRLLTPAEHARVKGIPVDIIAGNSDTTAHMILGQSVIYPKFEALGHELGRALLAAVDPVHALLHAPGHHADYQSLGTERGAAESDCDDVTEMPVIRQLSLAVA